MSRSAAIGVAAAAVVAVLVAIFLYTHDRVEEEIYTGFQGEAAYNDFLAAEMLLSALDIDSDSRESMLPSDWLPDGSDTLIMRAHPEISVGDELALLYDWVAVSGGHLVLLAPAEDVELTAALFEAFGVSFDDRNGTELVDLAAAGPAGDADDDTDGNTNDSTNGDGDASSGYELFLTSGVPRLAPVYSPTATVSDEHGLLALRLPVDNGFVTAVATAEFFTNDWLASADHGRLLLDAVAGFIEPGKVWFAYSVAFPSLLDLIWQAAHMLVTTLAVLLLLAIWRAMPRFGPPMQADADERRSILEHIDASGQFSFRNGGSAALLDGATHALLDAAERKHPGISRLPASRQAELIAHMTEVPEDEILGALTAAGPLHKHDFAETILTLKKIKEAL